MAQSSTGTGITQEITITDDIATATTVHPVWATGLSGSLPLFVSSTGIGFVPSTGQLTCTGFTGPLTGNASTATILQTTRTINGTGFNGSSNISILPSFTSSDQTITAAGSLTIAHGLPAVPNRVMWSLVNVTADQNYVAGDVVFAPINNAGGNQGVAVVPDATNLVVRFGSGATVFQIVNKTTGALNNITVANWRIRFYAQVMT